MKIFEQMERRRRWTGPEQLLLDAITRIAAEVIKPSAEHVDRRAEFPWRSLEALNLIGVNRIFVPEAYGGAGMSSRVYLAAVKLVAEACASTGIIYATGFNAAQAIIGFGSEEQKHRYLPRIASGAITAISVTERGAGSDATALETLISPQGDHLVINGEKQFINNGDVADLIVLFGKYARIEDPRRSLSVVVLEKGTPGLEVFPIEHKMGHRGCSTSNFRLSGSRVPRANLLGRPGDGLAMLLTAFNRSRPSIAAHALGIAYAAFKDMVEYMNARRQSGRRIIDFQGNQFLLADLASDLALADSWLDVVGAMMDEGDGLSVAASMSKMRATDVAMRMTTEAVQMFGGYGYCRDLRVERLMRDAKATQIWEGANQVHRQLIGRSFAAR